LIRSKDFFRGDERDGDRSAERGGESEATTRDGGTFANEM